MKELINVAERLYKQLDDLREKLAPNLNGDDNQILLRTECFMLNVIKHKDNIVDLSEVWHKYNSKQIICDDIIARYKDDILVEVHNQCDIDIFFRDNRHLEGEIYFSFVKDLLPKGGGK